MNKPVKDQQAPALVCPLPVWSGVLHASGRRVDPVRVQVASVRRVRTCGDGETLIEMADAPDLVVEETMEQVIAALGCGADGYPLEEAPVATPKALQSSVLGEVAAVRARQVAKGYDMEECIDGVLDDSRLRNDELAQAALTILVGHLPDGPESLGVGIAAQVLRLYSDDQRQQLIIAAALLIAEVERMDRKTAEESDR